MRHSRAAYHYANRAVSYDVSERIDNCNFWSEVKKIRSSRPAKCRTVDGITNENDIAQLFASSYQDLYTNVSYNVYEMKKLIQVNDARVKQIGYTKDCTVSACDAKRAVSRLKAGLKIRIFFNCNPLPPTPLFPSPPLPSRTLSSPSPLPSLPLPSPPPSLSLPLEVGPLNAVRGSGGAL